MPLPGIKVGVKYITGVYCIRCKVNGKMSATKLAKSKLTWDDVNTIRYRYTPGCRDNGQAALAREYGVATIVIFRIVHDITWNPSKYIS